MPSDDYTPVIRGGLKLKGSKPTGIKKKKKKSSTTPSQNPSSTKPEDSTKPTAEEITGEEDELSDSKLRELDPKDDSGKTASERAYEEMRRKRVRTPFRSQTLPKICSI